MLCATDAPPATIVGLQRTLAEAGLVMSAGQQRDLALTGSHVANVERVEATVAGKSGEAVAMLAAMAAQLADAPDACVERFAAMGRALGIAGQFRSDCHDFFTAADSRDIAHGTRTLPIILYLQNLQGDDREAFLALLNRAQTNPRARTAARERLLEAGILHGCAVVIELHCQRARAALAETGGREPAAGALRRMIDSCSFYAEGAAR